MEELTRADVAEKFLFLDGKPLSLYDYPFYYTIYNGKWTEMIVLCGRQVAKSTTATNKTIVNSIAMPHFKTLYVAPTQKQTSIFSNSRLGKTILGSPYIRNNFVTSAQQMSVYRKAFSNGSEVNLSYASDDPDRVRGYSSDEVNYDEIQDIVFDSVVPVINETMANSEYGWVSYYGTPKSMENTAQVIWERSTQDEWIMKCSGCNKWNYVNSTKSIGKFGVICVNCGKYLNPRDGRWHSMSQDATTKGFHISQLILPKNNESVERWNRILHKYNTYSESKFKNEVLGVSDALGTRMVSLEDLEACCRNYVAEMEPNPKLMEGVKYTVAGVDWSGGGSSTFVSRTVVWVWGVMEDQKLKTLCFKIFPTANAVQDVRDIVKICQAFNCKMVCGDAGVGATANALLAEKLGAHRVMQVQYGSLAKRCSWNKKDRYMVDKTAAIDTLMFQYKQQGVVFPHKNQMKVPFKDILAEYEQVTKQGAGKRVWTHSPLVPDDSLHAQTFGWFASEIVSGRVSFYKTDYDAYLSES